MQKTPTWEVPLPDWMGVVAHVKWARTGSFHVVQHNGDKTHLWLHFGPEERDNRRAYMLAIGPLLIVFATLWGATKAHQSATKES